MSVRQELSHLTNSFAQLKQAQAKFRSCIESAKEVKPENKGTVKPVTGHRQHSVDKLYAVDKTILVPLTSSLYVPGKLRDMENVIIEVGTGYYVQKVRACFLVRRGLCMHTGVAIIDSGSGREALRGKNRVHQAERGHAAGDDTKEAGQHVLLGQRHSIEASEQRLNFESQSHLPIHRF